MGSLQASLSDNIFLNKEHLCTATSHYKKPSHGGFLMQQMKIGRKRSLS
jgi:hypothetical protein